MLPGQSSGLGWPPKRADPDSDALHAGSCSLCSGANRVVAMHARDLGTRGSLGNVLYVIMFDMFTSVCAYIYIYIYETSLSLSLYVYIYIYVCIYIYIYT